MSFDSQPNKAMVLVYINCALATLNARQHIRDAGGEVSHGRIDANVVSAFRATNGTESGSEDIPIDSQLYPLEEAKTQKHHLSTTVNGADSKRMPKFGGVATRVFYHPQSVVSPLLTLRVAIGRHNTPNPNPIMALMNKPPSRFLLVGLAFVLFTSLLVWYSNITSWNDINLSRFRTSTDPSYSGSSTTSESRCVVRLQQNLRSIPQKRQRVAIASTFGYHFDVYLALAWTMQRVMSRPPNPAAHDLGGNGTVAVYTPEPKFHFGFDKVIDALGLYKGEIKPSENLFDDLDKEVDGHKIDLVVLGTCEVDLRGGSESWHQRLLDVWDLRPDDEKFMVVCIIHDVRDEHWQSHITEWARRGAIRFLPISQHVANSFKSVLLTRADNTRNPTIRLAGYEYLKVDTHVPILNLSASDQLWTGSSTPKLPLDVDIDLEGIDHSGLGALDSDGVGPASTHITNKMGRKLSRAVIQGSFSTERREYETVFRELIESLTDDPSVWGYLPLKEGEEKFVVDPKEKDPFYLYLLGSGGLNIPKALEDMVIVKKDLDYAEFYHLMQTMDICVPAFNPENGYYRFQASSTMVMALQCNVPILATRRVRSAYAYADDDRVMVTRPAVISEVAALRALRIGNMTSFWDHYTQMAAIGDAVGGDIMKVLPSHGINVYDDLGHMMEAGWRRADAGFESFREGLWKENERVVEKFLRDL
ncbi:hypothetical protein CVT24_006546 [Panaeolus cyanescens]|uniref:Uncharacterized protein n=1 Tax=Panaeolus cyanescens TaxID=181874 RepID=A0A409YX91_9AGAR|nr:hypothetical protein CVT24_006546 [Panaeolus cyanescens]